jgi:carbonic anhydrase
MVNVDGAPVNILSSIASNNQLNCTSTCNLTFVYNPSACVVKKNHDFLSIAYDKTNHYPVVFNQIEYRANEIHIYQPSLHTYNGTRAAAELLAFHSSQTGEQLIISIPIEIGGDGKQSSKIMNEIFQNLPTSVGASKSIPNITNFNLGDIIPKAGFYTYTANHLINKTGVYTYVVYNKKDAITVASDSMKSLRDTQNRSSTAIQPKTTPMTTKNTTYLYNKNGANNAGTDDYYLQCDNTGSDGTILFKGATPNIDGKSYDSTSKSLDWKALIENNDFKRFIIVILAVMSTLILIGAGYFIIKWFGKDKVLVSDNATGV